MIRAAIIALLAAPALADPAARWGASTAVLQSCAEADACVTVINQLSAAPTLFTATLSADGLAVDLVVVMGDGAEPDRATITPPPGWLVMPPWADIPEGEAVVFRLFAPVIG